MDRSTDTPGSPWLLPGLTALSWLVYWWVFSRPFPLTDLYTLNPPVDYAKLTTQSWSGLLAFVLGVLILFVLYTWVLDIALPVYAPYLPLIFAATLFFSYPTLAIDLLIYAVRTRGWAVYGLNPLAIEPENFPAADPWLGLAGEWADIPSPYGPAWEGVAWLGHHLVGGNFLALLFFLKLIAILAYLGCVVLIGRILQQLSPAHARWGMVAFAWNPLVLLETAQNAHNDILMILLLLAAIWALATKRHGWVMPLLALSVLVKFVTILLAPLFLLYLAWQHESWLVRVRTVLLHGGLLMLLIGLGMWPLWPGLDAWGVTAMNSGAGRSVLALGVLLWREVLPLNTAFTLSRVAVNLLCGGILLGYLWHSRRQLGQLQTLLRLGWAVFFWYVLWVIPVFHAWYLLWSLPLAILLWPERRAFAPTLVFCLSALLIIPYFETLRLWYPILLQNALLGHLIGVPLLVGPPLWAAIRSHRRSSDAGT